MKFSTHPRDTDAGKFVAFSATGRPVAQIFVPNDPQERQFSFFWRGEAQKPQVHRVLSRLYSSPSDLKTRFITSSSIFSFEFALVRDHINAECAKWHLEFAHKLIDAADIPVSVGITMERHNDHGGSFPVYIWASINEQAKDVDTRSGNPEIGIKVSVDQWNDPVLKEALQPLLESTAGLNPQEAKNLWTKAAKTAKSLVM